MGNSSKIEWTEATWNPVAGCAIVSPGCTNCYAMRLASRLEKIGQKKYEGLTRSSGGRPKWNGKIVLDHNSLDIPRSWRSSKLIFVNSMSDIFHDDVPIDFINKVFQTIQDTSHHTYQILTKRSTRLLAESRHLVWPRNLWMGVSVEDSEHIERIEHLKKTPAGTKFLSLEPLLGPIEELNLSGIDWVIAGGESGPGARPMKPEWVRSIRDACLSSGVPFHFKQWGGTNKKASGRELDGRTWDELPPVLSSKESVLFL